MNNNNKNEFLNTPALRSKKRCVPSLNSKMQSPPFSLNKRIHKTLINDLSELRLQSKSSQSTLKESRTSNMAPNTPCKSTGSHYTSSSAEDELTKTLINKRPIDLKNTFLNTSPSHFFSSENSKPMFETINENEEESFQTYTRRQLKPCNSLDYLVNSDSESPPICRKTNSDNGWLNSTESRILAIDNRHTSKIIKNYNIVEKIGDGSFSTVYRIKYKDDLVFALKKTKEEYHGYKHRERLLNEVFINKKIANNNNPNIVDFVAAFELNGHLNIIFEIMEFSLSEYLKRIDKTLSIDSTMFVVYEVCNALHYLHNQNIVHMDLKPQNILLDKKGRVKICDFGVAVDLSQKEKILQDYQEGDRRYIAIEVLSNEIYTPKADMFSLGLIMLELCCGLVLPDYGDYWNMLRFEKFEICGFEHKKIPTNSVNLIKGLMKTDYSQRPSAEDILNLKPSQSSNTKEIFFTET